MAIFCWFYFIFFLLLFIFLIFFSFFWQFFHLDDLINWIVCLSGAFSDHFLESFLNGMQRQVSWRRHFIGVGRLQLSFFFIYHLFFPFSFSLPFFSFSLSPLFLRLVIFLTLGRTGNIKRRCRKPFIHTKLDKVRQSWPKLATLINRHEATISDHNLPKPKWFANFQLVFHGSPHWITF